MIRTLRLCLLPLILLSMMACSASAEDAASAYQINPTHTGAITTPNLTPPLIKAWSVNLGDSVSYPLIAHGKVFVTVGGSSTGGYGARLYALNAQTGQVVWGPKALPTTYYWANAAYDAGLVYVIDYDGVLRAYNADTGAYLWHRQMPGQYSFSSPPSAHDGAVYVGGAGDGGTLYAVKETTGKILWTASVENGDNSSPAVTGDGVYVSYAGQQTYKFDPLTGDLLWHYDSGIEGGGGKTPVYYGGRLYVRDDVVQYPTQNDYYGGLVFNSVDGTIQRPFGPGYDPHYTAPAFSSNIGIFVNGPVQAQDAASGSTLWTFTPPQGSVVTAPIIVNGVVYVGTGSGVLYGLDLKTGKVRWSDTPGGSISGPDEQNVSQPLTGMAAAQSLLVVPTTQALVAYRQVSSSQSGQ